MVSGATNIDLETMLSLRVHISNPVSRGDRFNTPATHWDGLEPGESIYEAGLRAEVLLSDSVNKVRMFSLLQCAVAERSGDELCEETYEVVNAG